MSVPHGSEQSAVSGWLAVLGASDVRGSGPVVGPRGLFCHKTGGWFVS